MDPTYKPGEKVNLVILRKTDLGFLAEINGVDEGLLYYNEIFEVLEPDQTLPGFIKKVRPDGGIDLMLNNFGNLGAEELGDHILEALEHHDGFIPVNAKSPAEEIYNFLGVSRNKFKMALGSLYKRRLIRFTETGTELVPHANP